MLPEVPTVKAGPKNAVASIHPFKVIKLMNKMLNFFIFTDSTPVFNYR